MQLKSVETTPNPNSMKLNLEEELGAAATYTFENRADGPEMVERLLEIEGLQSVFVCHDFLTLNKDPRANWQDILEMATSLFGKDDLKQETIKVQRAYAEREGQVQVLVQTFKGIPIQVKVVDAQGQTSISLGERFNEAAQLMQTRTGANYLKERYWADHGVRYGDRIEVANEVVEEIRGVFDEEKLGQANAAVTSENKIPPVSIETLKQMLHEQDWHKRLMAVQELSQLHDALPLLTIAIKDSNPQVRRLSAAALGATGSTEAVDPLCDVLLNDQSVGVRRTAGDALSDIGDPSAQPAICRALGDANKLVRWRAARFLSDIGTKDALPFLEKIANDPEFEVRLEVESAIQRIRGGLEGLGPAWKRIVEKA
jgi:Virulence factor/HEAT repeats/Scaffold protein Nfu/NifU N terminal